MNTPEPYDEDPKKAEKFLDQCELYLYPNRHVFDTEEAQIMFTLSYISKGAAQAWAHNFLAKVRTQGTGTWANFKTAFTRASMGSDVAGDARATLMQTRQGWDAAENKKIPDETVDSYATRFQVLAETAQIGGEYGILSLYFQQGLNKDVCNRIYSCPTLPTTMEEWYQAAQQTDKQLRILKKIESGAAVMTTHQERDPNAMDIDKIQINRLSAQEREKYFKEGRCFNCGNRGHCAAECRTKKDTSTGKEKRTFKNFSNRNVHTGETSSLTEIKETKEEPKEALLTTTAWAAKIRALLAGLSQEEHEQVYDALEKEGF